MKDAAIPRDCNNSKREQEKLEKSQGLKENIQKLRTVKASVNPVVIRAYGAVTHKTGRRVPKDPRNNLRNLWPEECSPRTAEILNITLKLPGLWSRTRV